ncbi:DsrE family protein [Thioclava pacifica]|uniref:Uncharacterized protein n=1 Tax=Thioclava pacifica DSM 10166 TaxID=1353537 RepID=A0A074J636_9RHOB|nr:DsrE family protein [Thioclava pacifica]KEO51974.1 hypothetical protein TP2_10890 [Thioclava pacifica DSM 10166]
MTKSFRLIVPAIAAIALGASSALAAGATTDAPQKWVNPVIKDYGQMHPVPFGALKPDPNKTWKVVFDLGMGKAMKNGVNAALWHVARAVNVYADAGVDREHRDFAVVLHGAATDLALSPAAYKSKFGKDDPNQQLKDELAAAGVKLYVCGQALADNDITPDQVGPHVEVALSALAAIPVLESEGYQLFEM